ncbi:MAG: hypothetical protein HFE78_05120 [Clostridiales bacterium]|nr:hypothetical protein [Clostridiales bacterium]
MFSKKLLKVACIMGGVYIVFAAVVLIGFHAIRNNPIDQIAMPYICDDEALQEQYGNIFSVGRNVTRKVNETENTMTVPYIVETDDKRLTVYVELEKQQEDWIAVSLGVVKAESR